MLPATSDTENDGDLARLVKPEPVRENVLAILTLHFPPVPVDEMNRPFCRRKSEAVIVEHLNCSPLFNATNVNGMTLSFVELGVYDVTFSVGDTRSRVSNAPTVYTPDDGTSPMRSVKPEMLSRGIKVPVDEQLVTWT